MDIKLPVVILSSPRTGSTALGSWISKSIQNNNARYFLEPDYDGSLALDEFKNFFATNKNFVFKTHLYNLHLYGKEIEQYCKESSDVYRIRIRRKNIIEQISSLYIAQMRKHKWHFKTSQDLELVDRVEINERRIKESIGLIKYANRVLDNTNIKFNLDLYYEDLGEMKDVGYFVAPKPLNHIELQNKITELLN